MKRTLLLLTILAAIGMGCNPNRIHGEHQDLSADLEWNRSLELTYSVNVEDATPKYDLILALRYITGYNNQYCSVRVTRTAPDGTEELQDYEIKVVNDNGEYLGEPGLDIWDLEQVVVEGFTYPETGTYTYKVVHNMPMDPLPYVMEFGLIVEKKV